METSDEACRIRQRDLDTLTTHIAETELQLRRERQDLLMAESEITRHRSAVTNIEVDLKSYQSRHADHANALHQLREQRAALEARHSETQTLTEARRAEIATARTQADATANEAKHLASEFRRIQLNLDITSPLFFHLLQSDKARCGNQYLGRGGREDLFYEQQNDNSTRH